jgi:hypothetical protein
MSRARNIKPGFFKNERLADCQPLARILFAGLWCEADRAGRLEDRPKRLKAEYLPYDTCNADALLDELEAGAFIRRYEVVGVKYIQILAFAKLQNPHVREPASLIPAPGEKGACTVPAPEEHSSSHADSPSLIPPSKRVASQPKGQLTLPDWLSAEAWAQWHAYRNARKGWTRHAQQLSLNTLTKLRRKGHDPTAVIERSIERGWTGLFELNDEVTRGTRSESRRESASERVARLCAEQDAAERATGKATDFFDGEFRTGRTAAG